MYTITLFPVMTNTEKILMFCREQWACAIRFLQKSVELMEEGLLSPSRKL